MTPDREAAGSLTDRVEELILSFLDVSAKAAHQRLGDVAGVAVSTSSSGRHPWTLGASNELARQVDQTQFAVGLGPCLEALSTGRQFYVPDLETDERWGEYGVRAAAHGVASCVSVPVLAGARSVAVLKVYSAVKDGLTRTQCDLAAAVASELAGGFGLATHLQTQATELENLTDVMTHRRVIDLALGISMERAQVSADRAFDLLRAHSQSQNVKVREVAAQIVASIPGATDADLVAHFNAPTEL